MLKVSFFKRKVKKSIKFKNTVNTEKEIAKL